MPKTRRPTPKERKLIELKVSGATHIEAYRKAYNVGKDTKDTTANANTANILKKPEVKQVYEQALQAKNITLERALTPIDKALDAMKQNQFTGEITEDLSLQLQASDRALKLLGVTSDTGVNSLHVHLHQQRDKYKL